MKKKICIGVGILLMILIVAGIITNYLILFLIQKHPPTDAMYLLVGIV